MAEMNLKSDYITDEELANLKKQIMKWYTPKSGDAKTDKINRDMFYKDAFEDLLGVWLYGHWGEHFRSSMMIGAWQREADKIRLVQDYMTDENLDCEVVIDAKESRDTCDPMCCEVYSGLVRDIPNDFMKKEVIQVSRSVTTGLPHIDIYAPEMM